MLFKHISNLKLKKRKFNFLKSNDEKSKLFNSYSQDHLTNDKSKSLNNIQSPRNSIKSISNSIFNSASFSKRHPLHLSPAIKPKKIFMRLEESDEIAKIIKEEEKKIYFKQRFNYGQHLSVEEFRSRFLNKIPQNTYKRKLERKLKEQLKSEEKILALNYSLSFYNLIKKNKKLIKDYKINDDEKDKNQLKRNFNLKKFFEKSKEEKNRYSREMSIQFESNKKEIVNDINNENLNKKVKDKEHMNEKNFRIYKKKQYYKQKMKMKEKSKVFSTILDDEFDSNFSYLEKDDLNRKDKCQKNIVNYKALSNKILVSNLIRQMRIIYLRDPSLNLIRGKQSKKIEDLKKEVSLFDDYQDLYNQKNNEIISLSHYYKKKLILPSFIKTKFKRKTNLKFGEVYDNYFGFPV